MKKTEKVALKKLKKGFTIDEWKTFSGELKYNELILNELGKKLELLDLNVVKELADLEPEVIKFLSYKIQVQIVNNENFHLLSEDLQVQIIEKNNNKVKYASDDAQVKFAFDNPSKLSLISLKNQNKVVFKNKFYLEYASEEVQYELAKKDIELLCNCSNLVQCAFIKNDPNFYLKCSSEIKKDVIVLNNLAPDKISIETLEAYISSHYENLSFDELNDYSNLVKSSDRKDKEQILNYLEYILVNIGKK